MFYILIVLARVLKTLRWFRRNIADKSHLTKVALANLNSKQTFPQFKIRLTPQKVELHLKFPQIVNKMNEATVTKEEEFNITAACGVLATCNNLFSLREYSFLGTPHTYRVFRHLFLYHG